jgi:plasmid stabilization system protein ParE
VRTVRWSRRALDQFKRAFVYLADKNPDAAQEQQERIRATSEALGRRPIGRPGPVANTHVKLVLGTRDLLIYRVASDDELWILRVYHSAQDWGSDVLEDS